MMHYARFCLLTVAALVVLLPGSARAQSFEVYLCDENQEVLDSIDVGRWINRARCLCDESTTTPDEPTVYLRVSALSSLTNEEVYFYIGDDCDNAAVSITEQCEELAVINHSDFNEDRYIPLPTNWVVDPVDGVCTEQDTGTSTVYVIMSDPSNTAVKTYAITYDTAPASAPEDVEATAGERSVSVAWAEPSSGAENIEYYDVLCSVGGRPPSGIASMDKASWISTRSICNREVDIGETTHADAGVADAGVGSDASVVADAAVDAAVPADAAADATMVACADVTGGFGSGDDPNPCFVCGSISATSAALEYRISGLTNGEEVAVGVVAVDKFGNPSAVSEVIRATPVPTTDFAEQYTAAGGKETGGFCFVATAVYGSYDHPEVQRLRAFRDGSLARTAEGRAFIAWYYREGRTLAAWVESSVEARLLVRAGLGFLTTLLPRSGAPAAPSPVAMLPVTLLLLGLIGLLGARLQPRADRGADAEVRR